MPRFEPFTSYEDVWEYVHGPEGIATEADAWFAGKFRHGHSESIRPFVQMMYDNLVQHGYESKSTPDACYFHARAVELLLKYGVDYVPDLSRVDFFRNAEDKPGLRQCFSNSRILMEVMNSRHKDEIQLTYVEGMVWGFAADPALHAWNSHGLADSRALDWTHYPFCNWSRYFGIPFTEVEYSILRTSLFPNNPYVPISLFDGQFFPLVEEQLLELLALREPTA